MMVVSIREKNVGRFSVNEEPVEILDNLFFFFFEGFFKDNVSVSSLPATLEGLKTRIAEGCAKMNHDIFQKALQEFENWFDITRVIPGANI
jgi:hypothetical protein